MPMQPVQPVQPVQNVQPVQSVSSAQRAQLVQLVQTVQTVQSLQYVQRVHPSQRSQSAQSSVFISTYVIALSWSAESANSSCLVIAHLPQSVGETHAVLAVHEAAPSSWRLPLPWCVLSGVRLIRWAWSWCFASLQHLCHHFEGYRARRFAVPTRLSCLGSCTLHAKPDVADHSALCRVTFGRDA